MKVTSRSSKARGELTEIRFLLAAAACGFIVCKPWGDNQPFDFIVYCTRSGRFHRIQVKSTSYCQARRYRLSTGFARNHRQCYTAGDIDFLVAYVEPQQAWYLIPVCALGKRKNISVYPQNPQSRGQFETFRDAWQLLSR